jgi:hypothetical protein
MSQHQEQETAVKDRVSIQIFTSFKFYVLHIDYVFGGSL